MKILLWHGYLLGGTGSNVYTRMLAREWSRAGHDVVVFCQEPHPDGFDLGGATVVRPKLPGPLPVFVLDRYEDLEARFLQDFTRAEREAYVEANAAAVREHLPADYLLVNHVLLGAPVGVASGAPFSVKAHGSELEFSIRGNPELAAWARESLDRADEVYAGSEHIERRARGGRRAGRVLGAGPDRPAGCRRRRAPAGDSRRGAGRARRRGAPRPAEPGPGPGAAPGSRRTPSGSPSSSPATSRPSSTSGS